MLFESYRKLFKVILLYVIIGYFILKYDNLK
jgi:hypothetical protein